MLKTELGDVINLQMVCTMNLILFFILLTIFLKIFPTFLFFNRVINVKTYDKRKEGN